MIIKKWSINNKDRKINIDMNNIKERIKFFILGVMILTLGVSLTIKANLGAGSWDSVNVGLNKIYGLSVGTCAVIIAIFMTILCAILRGGKLNLYTLITAICLGLCTDFWLLIVDNFQIESSIILRIITLILGIILLALGISLYLIPRLAPNPIDDFIIALSDKLNISVGKVKMIVDISGIVIAFLLSSPIGFGTVVITLVIGPLIDIFTKKINLIASTY